MKKISQREILNKKLKNFTPTQEFNWFFNEHLKFLQDLKEMIKRFKETKKNMSIGEAKKELWRIKYMRGTLKRTGLSLIGWKQKLAQFEEEYRKRKES